MTKIYVENTKNFIEKSGFENITLLDFYNNPPLNINDDDYYDYEHLNETGAIKFSKVIKKYLNDLKHD